MSHQTNISVLTPLFYGVHPRPTIIADKTKSLNCNIAVWKALEFEYLRLGVDDSPLCLELESLVGADTLAIVHCHRVGCVRERLTRK
jgi:hypothetical protein